MEDVPRLGEMAARGRRILVSPWAGGVLLLALLIVTAAYQFNVPTTIKLGSGYDLPYLNSYDLAYIDNWAGGVGDAGRFDNGSGKLFSRGERVELGDQRREISGRLFAGRFEAL